MKKTRCLHEESGPGGHSPRCQEMPVTSKLLIPVPEVARLLGVSRRTVFLLLASGDLTRRKVRRRTMIHLDEVIQFADRRPRLTKR